MDDERPDLVSIINRQCKTLEGLANVTLHFELTKDEERSLKSLIANMERQLASNRRLMIRRTKKAATAKKSTAAASEKKKSNKSTGKRYCAQCKESVPAAGFLQHFKHVHGRPPTPGEKNQSRKHRPSMGTTYEGDRPPRGPTVQGGSPGLGRRS